MNLFFWKKTLSDRRGFTILELMTVMLIIGIISTIAIPRLTEYLRRGWETSAVSDAKNGFNAAQAFFTDWPQEQVTVDLLKEYGYQDSPDVDMLVVQNRSNNLVLRARHVKTRAWYYIIWDGFVFKITT